MEFNLQQVEEALKQLGTPASSGQEYTFDCPFCGKENHLYINPMKGKYNCFKCNNGGGIKFLLKKMGVQFDEAQVNVSTVTVDDLKSRLKGIDKDEKKIDPVKAGLPDDYWEILPDTEPSHYLLSRGLTWEDIKLYRIGHGFTDLNQRVIFPAFDDDGECLIYSARDYTNNQTLRYKTPKGISKSEFVPYLNIARNYETVIICEGAISAIIAGRNAVATYGKGFSLKQIEQLLATGFKEYYVAFDGDTQEGEALKLAFTLWRRKVTTYLIPIPQKDDPASLGREEFQRIKNEKSVLFNDEAALKLRFQSLL